MKVQFSLPVVVCMVLTACGSSAVTDEERLATLSARGNDIFNTFIDGDEPIAASALPSTGTAQYTGPIAAYGGVGNPGNDTEEVRVGYLGDGTLNIVFADGTLSGSATDFLMVEDGQELFDNDELNPTLTGTVTGELTFVGEQLDDAEALFDVAASGTLEGQDGSVLVFQETGGVVAVFGENSEAVGIVGGVLATFDDEDGFVGYSGALARE